MPPLWGSLNASFSQLPVSSPEDGCVCVCVCVCVLLHNQAHRAPMKQLIYIECLLSQALCLAPIPFSYSP